MIPDADADVAFMAEEIAPGCQDSELIGRARRIAEAQVDLMRVARARRNIISAAMADPDYRPATGLTGRIAIPGEASDPDADKLVAVLSDIGARLATLTGTNVAHCLDASAPSARSTRRTATRP